MLKILVRSTVISLLLTTAVYAKDTVYDFTPNASYIKKCSSAEMKGTFTFEKVSGLDVWELTFETGFKISFFHDTGNKYAFSMQGDWSESAAIDFDNMTLTFEYYDDSKSLSCSGVFK